MEREKELMPRASVPSALAPGKSYPSEPILNSLGSVLGARTSLVVTLDSPGSGGMVVAQVAGKEEKELKRGKVVTSLGNVCSFENSTAVCLAIPDSKETGQVMSKPWTLESGSAPILCVTLGKFPHFSLSLLCNGDNTTHPVGLGEDLID